MRQIEYAVTFWGCLIYGRLCAMDGEKVWAGTFYALATILFLVEWGRRLAESEWFRGFWRRVWER